jgi:succinoglycan biosynthesis transport protein ExoP
MPTQSATNEVTISGLLTLLRRRRPIILATTAVMFIIAALVCIFMTREYESRAEIQVAKSASDGIGLENLVNPMDSSPDALTENMTLQTQANILQSDSLALKVIQDLNLEHSKDYKPIFDPIGWALGLISPSGPSDPSGASLADSPKRRARVIKIFEKRLSVKPVSGTRLIDITYISSDRNTAADVVNHLTAALISYTSDTRNAATTEATQWLAGQLEDVRKQAEAQQQKVEQLQGQSGVYALGGTDSTGKDASYSLTLDRLEQATTALTAAESTRILKGSIYEMVKNKDPELLSGLAGSSLSGASQGVMNSFNLLQTLRGQEATLQSKIATDSSKYGSANPKLADEKASLASIKQQIQDEAVRIGERAKNDYEIAQGAENALRTAYEQDKNSAGQLNDKATQYAIAKQEADESRKLYDTLLQRMKEAGAVEGLKSTNISIVDPGRPAGKPAKPNVPLYLAASIFVGLFLGCMGAFFVDATDDKIQSFKPVAQDLNIPLLAVLPRLGEAKGLKAPLFKQKQLAEESQPSSFPRLAVVEGSGTAFAEALRGLRTAIEFFPREAGGAPRVILVTSSVPHEGKSTISSNLATLMAQAGERVLLIEGDMRQPSFASRFGPSGNPQNGLSALLSANGSRNIGPAIETTPVAGLHVLYAGPVPPFPSELLGKNRMRDLLEDLKPKFDRIVIDSPPLLAVTDALILSHIADMTLLIAREDLTTLKSLRRASDLLDSAQSAEVGVVLNDVSRNSESYEDYCSYSGDAYYQEAGAVRA